MTGPGAYSIIGPSAENQIPASDTLSDVCGFPAKVVVPGSPM
jgi:hypothetical protein